MQDLNDLFYFVQVVDHGGFAPAGRALGLQKSKLSRRILLLEERLGVRLLNRSSRRFSITEIGREYYDRCAAMLVEAEGAEQVVAQVRAEPRGIIRLSCPTALLAFQFGALLARFMAAHPAIEVHLEGTNRRVDVIAEGFDIAIRVRFPPLAPSDLVMRQLDQSTQCLVASPMLVAQALFLPPILPACRASTWGRRIASMPGNSAMKTAERRRFGTRPAWSPTTCRHCATRPMPGSAWCSSR
jgi:DNA-binding transcriptional LysR family regulator